jgi:heat shock protein HslJ
MAGSDEQTYTWVAESIGGVPTFDPKPQLSLTEDGRVVGTTGWNHITGTYVAENELVRITGTGMSRRQAPAEVLDQERRFVSALEGWHSFRVEEDGRLQLGPAGRGILLVLADAAPRA